MSKVVVFTNLTLDGVMQAPGRADEDRRGAFEHGGWATPYAAMARAGKSISYTGALLLGRRTYEDFYAFWPNQTDNPYTEMRQRHSLSRSHGAIPHCFRAMQRRPWPGSRRNRARIS